MWPAGKSGLEFIVCFCPGAIKLTLVREVIMLPYFLLKTMGSVLLKMSTMNERAVVITWGGQRWGEGKHKQATAIFGMSKSSIHNTNNIYEEKVLLIYKGS